VIDRLVPSGLRFSNGDAATLAVTYFTAGLAVSVLHVTQGTDPLVVIAAAFIVNSATSTLAFAAVATTGGSTAAGVLSGWLVATRFGLFAAALGPSLWPQRWRRAVSAHLAFDPSVALALREQDDSDTRRAFVAAGLWLCIPWWTSAVVGALVADRLGDTDALGFDVILPALLLAIVWPQLRDRTGALVAAVSVFIALGLVGFTPGGVPELVAGSAALLALTARPPAPQPSISPDEGATSC
jgi:predicted branched-subunit amino acid permease